MLLYEIAVPVLAILVAASGAYLLHRETRALDMKLAKQEAVQKRR